MTNRIAVLTNTYHGFTLDEALQGIAAAGFRYVELAAVRGWTEHVMPEMKTEQLEEVKTKLSDLGLTAIGLSGHCDLMKKERLEDFRKNMDLASFFGCSYIISSVGEAHFGDEKEVPEDVLVENLRALVPDLEKRNLVMAIETHGPDYGTGEALADVVKAVGSSCVGINYDTANAVFWGGAEDPVQEVRNCLPEVRYVHLKDKDGDLKDWNFPAVGKGKLNLKGFMEVLDDAGYAGPYSIEIEFTEDFTMRDKVPEDLEIANRAVKESYEYLRSIGRI